MSIKILTFAGSTRSNSVNKRLAKVALNRIQDLGYQGTFVDLRDLEIPLYDGDLETNFGLPKGVIKLKRMMINHDGFIISSPDYNGLIPPVLKNAIDWVSRKESGEKTYTAFKGKCIGLLSTSGGKSGGHKGLVSVRQVLTKLGSEVIPRHFGLPKASLDLFEDNSLKDLTDRENLNKVVDELIMSIKNSNDK